MENISLVNSMFFCWQSALTDQVQSSQKKIRALPIEQNENFCRVTRTICLACLQVVSKLHRFEFVFFIKLDLCACKNSFQNTFNCCQLNHQLNRSTEHLLFYLFASKSEDLEIWTLKLDHACVRLHYPVRKQKSKRLLESFDLKRPLLSKPKLPLL